MSSSRFPQPASALLLIALAAAACANPKRIDEGPITVLRNGDRVAPPVRAIDDATSRALDGGIAGRDRRDSLAAVAFASCAPSICAALGRGEVALGMTDAQVYVATRTTELAWTVRRSADATVMTPRDAEAPPRDAVASVALVQLSGGAVATIAYREPQGLRTVTRPADASDANVARAAALVREGDAMAAAGDFAAALDRYDRASVVSRAGAELQYRLATTLDKLLRPREAELRYRLFLHQLEIEKIEAHGEANAKLAEAIAQARERLVVLERRTR